LGRKERRIVEMNPLKGKIAEGFLALIKNTKRKNNANHFYIGASIEWNDNGTEELLYFTEHQMKDAKDRGIKMCKLVPKQESTFLGLKKGYNIPGHAVFVDNIVGRRGRQSKKYMFIKLIDFDGKTYHCCFTPNEIKVAVNRGTRCYGIAKKSMLVDFLEDVTGRF